MSTARRRQNSVLSLPYHTRQKSRAHLDVNSPHISDPFLQSFLGPTFNPAEYLNSTLPPLQTPSRSNNDASAVPLADLSIQAQNQLSQLNAHTTRLTNTLTQLTDDILRSGSRLAYEVELLRGETLSLSEALTDRLHDDVVKFVPDGLHERVSDVKSLSQTPASAIQRRASVAFPALSPAITTTAATDERSSTPPQAGEAPKTLPTDPAYITQLQTLTLVRSRLEAVVKTFGDAMEFVFPPSELSVSSSFLSVSAPEPGSEDRSTEEKGQKVLQQFRDEIAALLASNNGASPDSAADGIEKAARRIEELKDLATVWHGTAEEKGRTRFIDSLAKMVEDRHRELLRELEQAGRRADGSEATNTRSANNSNGFDAGAGESRGLSGYGIMSQLQRLRTGL
ncbi:hypothetical protein GGR50DRAFT_636271 [Xylaria sp. CBS 124048]|nr:hypothetical protein GGR50DRAFT_636271 [Xylaria sp. CBS 124048]